MQLNPGSGYTVGATVTPSDSTLVTCRAIWVGGAGNLAVSPSASATAVTYQGVAAGDLIPIALDSGRIMSTGTTATLICTLV